MVQYRAAQALPQYTAAQTEQQVKRYQIYAAATADFCLRIYYTALS